MSDRDIRLYPGANVVLPAEAELVHALLSRGVFVGRVLGYLGYGEDPSKPAYTGNLVYLKRYIKEAAKDYRPEKLSDRKNRARKSVAPEVDWCLSEPVSHALLSSFFSNWYSMVGHGVPFALALIIAFDQHQAQIAQLDEDALRVVRVAVRDLIKERETGRFHGPIRSGFKPFLIEQLIWIHDRITEGQTGSYGAYMTSCGVGHEYLVWRHQSTCPKCVLVDATSSRAARTL